MLRYNTTLCGDFPHFSHTEFRCHCGVCSGYPAYLDARLLYRLECLRRHFGKPVHISSGLRCTSYNDALPGSAKASGHLFGRAADVYIHGVKPSQIVTYWKSRDFGFAYSGTKNMGNCAHVEVSVDDF